MTSLFRHWGIGFTTAVALLSGIAALTPIEVTLTRSIFSLASAVLFGVGFARYHSKRVQLPLVDTVPTSSGESTDIVCPCDSVLARQANNLASSVYRREAIPFDRYEQWRLKNDRILVCLVNKQGKVTGYFDILPLRPSSMDAFIDGKITEHSFSHGDICTPLEAGECTRLYLGGMAVSDPGTHTGKTNAHILVWGLMKYLEHFYASDKDKSLYALASSKEGEDLLHRFDFKLASSADARINHHDLYYMTFSLPKLTSISQRILQWGHVVHRSWIDDSSDITR